ncbi:hypothetical protein [Streptomyces sp. H021]|uniref:hypothetical protein n=1 Tax=Streptomyces sp. H021 TaxID=1519486 RepID=UPI0006AE00E3|nr:hypothetical protein [Streptomyces sp. H021]KOV47368.1 hypothetical protein ADK97_03445 [Streptomyces sp. H021]
MGFTGELVFGRSDRPLLRAPVFGGAQEDDAGGITSWRPRPGGWQTWQFHRTLPGDPDHVVRALVEWTGAPACIASVHDSDVALVVGLEPGGERWDAWLNLKTAAAMTDRPLPELAAHVTDDAAGALSWARSAGFGENVAAATIEATLHSHDPFAEELFDALLNHLGFPPAPAPGTATGGLSAGASVR